MSLRAKYRPKQPATAKFKWPKPTRSPSKHSRRERDTGYMRFVKMLPCCAQSLPGADSCRLDENGHVEAAHTGKREGARANDRGCIPLCSWHHRDGGFDQHKGPFLGWTREQREVWAAFEAFGATVRLMSVPR